MHHDYGYLELNINVSYKTQSAESAREKNSITPSHQLRSGNPHPWGINRFEAHFPVGGWLRGTKLETGGSLFSALGVVADWTGEHLLGRDKRRCVVITGAIIPQISLARVKTHTLTGRVISNYKTETGHSVEKKRRKPFYLMTHFENMLIHVLFVYVAFLFSPPPPPPPSLWPVSYPFFLSIYIAYIFLRHHLFTSF